MSALLDFYEEVDTYEDHWRNVMARSRQEAYICISTFELQCVLSENQITVEYLAEMSGTNVQKVLRWFETGMIKRNKFKVLATSLPDIADRIYLRGDL